MSPRYRPVAVIWWIAAGLLLVGCVAPFFVWGNPYPPSVLIYWVVGIAGAAVVFLLPDRLPPTLARGLAVLQRRLAGGLKPWVLASVAFTLSLLIARIVFGLSASTPDEIAQYWHARLLLTGRLSLPVDPNPEFFSLETVVDAGRWYSQFPIGGPISLLPGALIGAPWLVNPLFAAIATLLVYDFARNAFGPVDGWRTAALFCVTPMMVFMAGTWMNHVPTMTLAVCAMAALARWDKSVDRRGRLLWSAVVGGAVGAIATVRPLDAIAVAVPIGLFQLLVVARERRWWIDFVPQLAAGVVCVLPLLIANELTTGDPLRFGYDVSWGAGHRVGFHADPYGNQYTLGDALDSAMSYLGELNMYLLGWPVPALLLIVAGCLIVRGKNRWDALVLSLFLSQLIAYSLYWGQGSFLGPRFLYTAVPALVIMVARIPSLAAEQFGEDAGHRFGRVLVACTLVTWLAPMIPFNAQRLAMDAKSVRRNLKADYAGAVRATAIHNAVVFLREPFAGRLSRRMWGVGLSRSEAARLVASRDACALHDSLTVAERLTLGDTAAIGMVRAAAPFAPGPDNVRAADERALITSPASISPSCRAELDADRELAGAPFGPALPLLSYDAEGRIAGDVIYAADLGEHNEVLRSRFPNREWYRLVLQQNPDGRLVARIAQY